MRSGRIKLLKFTPNFCIGGTEKLMVNLSRALDPARFELHMACMDKRGDLLKEVQAIGMPVSEYNINRLYNYGSFKERLKFARYLRYNRIQIVHAYNFYSNVFAVPMARLAGVPVIVASIQDMGVYLTPMKKRAQKLACRLADCVLVNAEAVKQWLISEGYNPRKITVIKNGIDLSRFERKTDGMKLRQELNLPLEAPLVAVISRLEPLKGIEYFLDAAALVAKQFPEVRFLIIGGGKMTGGAGYVEELKKYSARLGLEKRVVFTGFRLDIPELLSEVAVSVIPSLSEGLPNALLEALAAGVPVVATNVGGNSEGVEEGITGLLVPPQDSQAIARALSRLLKNPSLAVRLGEAGRKCVAERFSLDHMVRETENLYQNLLEERAQSKESGTKNGRDVEVLKRWQG